MKEFKFATNPDEEGLVMILSHSHEEIAAMPEDEAKAGIVKACNAFCVENDITPEIFKGVMYIPYEFYFDEDGAAGYRGPDADDPWYIQERFTAAMDKFTADTLEERGFANPDEAWINVGGTYCCGPTWKENPHYTGIPTAHPESAVH